jgi:hypothetical protein
MKKNLIALAVAAAVLVPGAAFAATSDTSSKVFLPENSQDTGPILYGLAQITGSQQFGTPGSEGLVFGAHRLRLGVKGTAVPGVTYNFQYKWDGAWTSNTKAWGPYIGDSGIQDAEINFGFIPEAQLKVGKFRVPVGMERTQFGGDDLWFIQRSMNQMLGADRGAGAMFHSSNLMGTGVYYSLGMFDNQSLNGGNAFAALQPGVVAPLGTKGQGKVGGILTNGSGSYLFAGMIGAKISPLLNVELSGARADAAGPSAGYARQIDSWNVGARGGLMGLKYMAEYSHVTSYQGVEGLGAQDWYVALAANLHQMTLTPDWLDIEPAFRFERFSWTGNNAYAGLGSGLNNYTIGVNYSFNPNDPYAARIQANYVIPQGASNFRAAYQAGDNSGTPGNAYLYNTMVLQFQAGF